jgi:hypothetical protein
MGMIIRRSLPPLNYSRTLRAVRRRETVRRSDDNSRWKVQNVRGDSSAAYDVRRPADQSRPLSEASGRQSLIGIFGNTSMLGANLPVAAGLALTFKTFSP